MFGLLDQSTHLDAATRIFNSRARDGEPHQFSERIHKMWTDVRFLGCYETVATSLTAYLAAAGRALNTGPCAAPFDCGHPVNGHQSDAISPSTVSLPASSPYRESSWIDQLSLARDKPITYNQRVPIQVQLHRSGDHG
jgi:hypothetical protein